MSYVDLHLHLHLLPGLDDGPRDLGASLCHAKRMVADGVREATVTPHVGHPRFAVDVAEIGERTRALQDALDAEVIPLRVHPGGEIHVDAAATLAHAAGADPGYAARLVGAHPRRLLRQGCLPEPRPATPTA